jgi:hypothetical protein
MTDTNNLDDMPDSYKDLLSQLDGETKPTQDDTPKTNKLSVRDKVFRKIVDGVEVAQLTQQERANTVVVLVANLHVGVQMYALALPVLMCPKGIVRTPLVLIAHKT